MVKEKGTKNIQSSLSIFVILSFVLTWTYTIPKALYSNNIITGKVPFIFEIVGAYGPAVAAIVTIIITDNKSGILELFKKLIIWKVNIKWYLAALFLQPAIWIAGILIHYLPEGEISGFIQSPVSNYLTNENGINPLVIIVGYFILQGLSLLGEELGWRGYMLPKLLTIKSWITSSIILGSVWVLWHMPFFFIKGSTQSGVSVPLYVIDLLAAAIIFTWIYINTKGSVLIATLFHASINTSTVILPVLPTAACTDRTYIIGISLKALISIIIIIFNKNSDKYKDLIVKV